MKPRLDAPNLMSEIPIGNAYQYVNDVDDTLKKDMEENTKVFQCLEDIIAFEVSRYLVYHIGGNISFDQSTADHLGRLAHKKRLEFEVLSGKEYICKNSDW